MLADGVEVGPVGLGVGATLDGLADGAGDGCVGLGTAGQLGLGDGVALSVPDGPVAGAELATVAVGDASLGTADAEADTTALGEVADAIGLAGDTVGRGDAVADTTALGDTVGMGDTVADAIGEIVLGAGLGEQTGPVGTADEGTGAVGLGVAVPGPAVRDDRTPARRGAVAACP